MNITYNKATLDDAYGIAYVSAYSWKETYFKQLPQEYLDNRVNNIEVATEKTKNYLSTYTGGYYVAKDNDKVIGIVAFENKDEIGYLGALYLLKQYHGHGIGKHLFTIAVDDLMNIGCTKMELECMEGNNTLEFYKRFGGGVTHQIDFPIKGVGTVKADVLIFDDLYKVKELLKNNVSNLTN